MVNFTSSEENYLKAVYHLQVDENMVTTNALAQRLNTRPASVTDMMKKLDAKKLLNYTPYYGFHLTDQGKKAALNIIRRHRLWEVFLAQKLGFSWEEVHSLAEELEHVSSKKLIDKLDVYLGHPDFDPHGDPIPDSRGRIKSENKIALDQLPLHQMVTVSRVANQSAEMLELLAHKNIRIGTKLEVKKVFPFDNSYELRLKPNSLVTVSEQLAKNIFVMYETES
jgi:DtxR family transcriptional regulator, Mn-dependent transcriptional regulator